MNLRKKVSTNKIYSTWTSKIWIFEEISDYKKLNTYVKEHKGTNKHYLFFDEIQHVSWFEKAINSFKVSFDCSIFITGSNSKMLSSEISTLLSGKIIEHVC